MSGDNKKVHIITYGCQMNVYDTARILETLAGMGYRFTDVPEEAKLILVNTCSVRAMPEQKVFGTLSRLLPLKALSPTLRFGVCGCVAQQYGEALLQRMPYCDLVFGPDNIVDLPRLIPAVQAGRRIAQTTRMSRDAYTFVPIDPGFPSGPTAFLTIMKGCDNVCSYCIVPRVRGREISKPPDQVMEEARALVAAGAKEITLLGQNVNSYGKDLSDAPSFSRLLADIHDIEGLMRLRFVTSHPADMDQETILAFRNLNKLAHALHLPVQSGSDRILQAMRRGYTSEHYLTIIKALKDACPDISLSTDIIVGYPEETEEDFQATLQLLRQVQYDQMYSFRYSPRPHTLAARQPDSIPETEKARRLKVLQTMQDAITQKRMKRFQGRTEYVLVEGKSARAKKTGIQEYTGRTTTNWVVNFSSNETISPGGMLQVSIDTIMAHSLRGRHLEESAL